MPAPSSAATRSTPIKARPAFGLNLPFQSRPDFLLASRPKLQGNTFGGTIPKPAADVIPADYQILTVLGPPADQDMNMRIVGVPMIDRDPVQFGSKIPGDVGHQLACEDTEIAKLGSILGRDDEAEVMPVIPASRRERVLVHRIRLGIEHPGFRSVPRHALTLQIGDVPGERRRAKARAVMPDHARLHHYAP